MQCVILSHPLFFENLNCQKDNVIVVYISKQELTLFWNLPTKILGITQSMAYKYQIIVKPNDSGILLENEFNCNLRPSIFMNELVWRLRWLIIFSINIVKSLW